MERPGVNVRNFFRRFWRGMPVRLAADTETLDRVCNVLGHIEGVGCHIEKPTGADGKGWLIVVDGASDVAGGAPDGYAPPWTTPDGTPPLDDDARSVEPYTPAGEATVRQEKGYRYDLAAPTPAATTLALDDWFSFRPTGKSETLPNPDATDTSKQWIQWSYVLSEIAADLVAAGGPWDGGAGTPWEDWTDGRYWETGGASDTCRGSSIADNQGTPKLAIRLQDVSGEGTPPKREGYETDGTTCSLDWSAQQAHVADPAAQTQADLTDSSGGTPSTTLPAISNPPTQAEVRDSIASLAAQLAAVKVDLASVRSQLIDALAVLEAYKMTAAS